MVVTISIDDRASLSRLYLIDTGVVDSHEERGSMRNGESTGTASIVKVPARFSPGFAR